MRVPNIEEIKKIPKPTGLFVNYYNFFMFHCRGLLEFFHVNQITGLSLAKKNTHPPCVYMKRGKGVV